MKVIILASETETQPYPLAMKVPKALMEIKGRRLLDHLMEKLVPFDGIRKVLIVTNKRFYEDFLTWKKRSNYEKSIVVIPNQTYLPDMQCGVVRDLWLAMKAEPRSSEDLLVLSGASYFDYPLAYFILSCLSHPELPFVGLYDLRDAWLAARYGVAQIDDHGRILDFEEVPAEPKSSLVGMGVYYFPNMFKLRLYEYLEMERRSPARMGDFIGWLVRKDPLYGVGFDGTWIDMNTQGPYAEVKRNDDAGTVCVAISKGDGK